jgi:hypothetical protein
VAEPFLGLAPYQETDAAYFFGRASERRVLVDNLVSSRLTLLYGESGTGKSSLLNAGVAHELRGDPEFTVISFRTWRDDPQLALKDAIVKATGIGGPGASLLDVIRRATQETIEGRRTLLILLDQFEEYFHYHPKGQSFDHELARVLNEPDAAANFVLAVREDWLAALDRFKGEIPGLFDNYLRMRHLSRAGAREAIEGPLEQFNREARNGNTVTWTGGLANHVIESIVTTQATAERRPQPDDRVQAPFLQLVMKALWQAERESGSKTLRPETLDVALGGARHVYQNHLASTLSKALTPAQSTAATEMFRFLVTGTGRKQNRTAQELCQDVQVEEALAKDTLSTLTAARVLTETPPPRGAPPTEVGYEFSHDVLAEAALRLVRQETLEAERRKAREADERAGTIARGARRLRFALLAFAAAFIAAVFALAVAWQMRGTAERAKVEAEASAKRADEAKRNAERSASVALASAVIQAASAAVGEREYERAVLLASQGLAVAGNLDERLVTDAKVALRAALMSIAPTVWTMKQMVLEMAWSLDRKWLVTTGDGYEVWNTDSKALIRREEEDSGWVQWSPVNERWLALSTGSKIRLIDGLTGREVFAGEGGRGPIAWHPTGAQLASGNARGVTIWSVPTGKPIRSWEAHGPITALAWSPDGERLATGGRDTSLRVWNPKTGQQWFEVANVFHADPDWMPRLWWGPKGTRLMTSDQNKPLTLRDASSGKVLRPLEEPRVFGNSALSHDGRWLAVTNPSFPLIKLFDTSNDYRLQYQIPISGSLLSASWSRDGRSLAVSSLQVSGWELLTLLNSDSESISNIVIYDMSPLFVDEPAGLFAISRQKVSRSLTKDECQQYLRLDECPPRP